MLILGRSVPVTGFEVAKIEIFLHRKTKPEDGGSNKYPSEQIVSEKSNWKEPKVIGSGVTIQSFADLSEIEEQKDLGAPNL